MEIGQWVVKETITMAVVEAITLDKTRALAGE